MELMRYNIKAAIAVMAALFIAEVTIAQIADKGYISTNSTDLSAKFVVLNNGYSSVFSDENSDPNTKEEPAVNVNQIPSFWDNLRFSGVLFLTYEYLQTPDERFNEFGLERGYITFRKQINPNVGVRFTQDITRDMEGDGEGDIELRLKYAFVHYNASDVGFFKNPLIEIGVVRRPWTDYEQSINDYRMQSSMFLDREKISTSADFGITVSTLFGEPLPNARELNIDTRYAGKYGSATFGVYNGGGYAALEKNTNKVVEGRVSFRPFWEKLPGLEVTYSGSYGKGNIPEMPDFWKNVAMVSYTSPKVVFATHGYYGKGDLLARRLYNNMNSIPMQGYSVFTEIMPFRVPISLVGRYEYLEDRNFGNMLVERGIVGLAWRFSNGSKVMLDYEAEFNNRIHPTGYLNRWEIATEVRF